MDDYEEQADLLLRYGNAECPPPEETEPGLAGPIASGYPTAKPALPKRPDAL
jgi:hypothetical protein